MNVSSAFRWKRVTAAILLGELIPIVILVVTVLIFGVLRSPDAESPEAFATRAGAWIGPIAGACCAFLFSWWAGRDTTRAVAQAAIIGVALAVIDIVILATTGTSFQPLLLGSNVGKIFAATLGGTLARGRQRLLPAA